VSELISPKEAEARLRRVLERLDKAEKELAELRKQIVRRRAA